MLYWSKGESVLCFELKQLSKANLEQTITLRKKRESLHTEHFHPSVSSSASLQANNSNLSQPLQLYNL